LKIGNIVEKVFLILIFMILLYLGAGNTLDHKISHDFPFGYFASDAFQHQIRAEAIKDAGNFKFEAPYISQGFENAEGRYPPVIYHLAVVLSYSSGLEVYDTIYFMVFFLISVAVLVFYLIMRDMNKQVAIIALPLSVLIFTMPNIIGFTWGHWPSIIGQAFLIMLFWIFHKIELKNSYLLIALFLSAIIMSHTSELVFGLFFIFLFILVNFLKNKLTLSHFKSIFYGGILSIIISFYYLVIFRFSWFVGQPYKFSIDPIWVGNPGFYMNNFKIFLFLILIGLLFSFFFIFSKKKFSYVALIAAISTLIMGYGNYFGFQVRSFQLRFLWPVYLSIFFGLGIYQILKFIIRRWNILYSVSISLLVLILIVFLANNSFITNTLNVPTYQKSTSPGVMDPFHWEILNWISQSTPEDSNVYFFYGDIYDQDALLRNSKRLHSQVVPNDFVENLNNRKISREYLTELPGDGGGGIVYRKSFFSFGTYDLEVSSEYLKGKRDICQFDYWIFDKISRQEALAQYNLLIANELLKKDFIEKVFENQVSVILKNSKPGENCIEERNF